MVSNNPSTSRFSLCNSCTFLIVLRLLNQVADEVRRHFEGLVFETVIHRNVKLSEAPSHGENIIAYDAGSKGAENYLTLAQELIAKAS
jgi:chromosome partitioning protein